MNSIPETTNIEQLRDAYERMQIMLDTIPVCAQFWNQDLELIDCNQETLRLFGISNKQELLKRFFEYFPEYQPDGRLSSEKSLDLVKKTFDNGYMHAAWTCQLQDGTIVPMEVTLIRVEHKGVKLVAAYLRDMREQKRMTHEIDVALENAEKANLALQSAQQTMSAMFESSPHINLLFNSKFEVIDCNPIALSFLGFETKKELLAGLTERINESIPEFQPDGRVSIPMAERFMTAARDGIVQFETELIQGGLRRTLSIELKRIPYENDFAIVAYVFDLTGIREREQELMFAREQNELQLAKLGLVIQATKIGLWEMEIVDDDDLTNPATAFIWSDEFRNILGFTDETDFPNLLGSWSERLHPEDKEATLEHAVKHLQDKTGNTPYDKEYRLLKKNGDYGYFRAYGGTHRDKDGNALRIAGALMDITEEKNALIHRELQLAKLGLVVQATRIGLWEMEVADNDPLNPNNTFMWSDEFRHLLGFSDETDFPNVLGSWINQLHPEDKPDTLGHLERYLLDTTGNIPYDKEYRLLKKNGEYGHFRAYGGSFRDEQGNVIRIAGAFMDITETKKTLINNELQLTKLDLVVKGAKIGLWDMEVANDDPVNPANTFMWSDELRRMLGFTDENDFPNVLSSWSDRLHPEDREKTLTAFVSHLLDTTGRTPYDIENRLMKKDGEYAYFRASGETIRDENGNPVRVAGALMDITETKKMTEALNEAVCESRNTIEVMSHVLNNADGMIYVTDKDTDELLFINDSLKRHFNIKDDVIGQPCYKVFNVGGAEERCKWCPCPQLDHEPDKAITWEEHNIITQRYYRNTDRYIDWHGGKQAHIQHRVELTDIKQVQEELENNQIMLHAVNDASSLLLNSDTETFHDSLFYGMQAIAEAVKVDRIHIWKNSKIDGELFCTQLYEWSVEGVESYHGQAITTDVPYDDVVPGWKEKLSTGECINTLVCNMPEVSQTQLSAQGVRALLAAPVFVEDQFWGFTGFDDCGHDRTFTKDEEAILRSSGVLFVNAWLRNEMLTSLRETSLRLEEALVQANAASRDLTLQKTTLQTIIDSIPDLVFSKDLDFRYTLLNASCVDYLNTNRESVIGRNDAELNFPDEVAEKMVSVDKRIIAGERRVVYDDWIPSFAGEARYLETTKAPIVQEGTVVGIVGISRDITEKMQMEKQLEAALVQAEAASKAKTDFLSTMSHEIRTPMNAILGIAEIQLQNDVLSSETKDALSKIHSAGDLLLGIINDILDLSKIEAGKLELVPAPYDVASLINDVVTLNMMRIGSKPIEFKLSVDKNTLATLCGDELRIKQILNNLLSNAFKYTVRGMVELVIFTEIKTESDVVLEVEVKDTGLGMTKEQINKLFDEYTRFNTKANRTTEGTGLGMNITRNLVSMMEGEIIVESVPDKGSTFTVRLPQRSVDSEVLGQELVSNLENFRSSSIKQMKRSQVVFEPMPYGSVLVVDDVESNIYVATGLLTPYNLTIDTAESGYRAVEKIKNGNVYDIIFMDHMMPGMDGIETTKLLRSMGYHEPIVALTANALVGQADNFLANGFDGFVSKPVDMRQLHAVLKKFIRDKQSDSTILTAHREKERQEREQAQKETAPSSVNPQLIESFLRDAHKAINTLQAIQEKSEAYTEEQEVRTYVINVHAMKSALANVGERELSALAAQLERAGRDNDKTVMTAETLPFLTGLKAVVEKLTSQKEETGKAAPGDISRLREKLLLIKEACENFDKKTAKTALAELREQTWQSPIDEHLEAMAEHLLGGDFEEVAATAERIVGGIK